MAEHALLAARIADAGDHRCVVQFVRIDDAAGQHLGQRGQRRLVRHIAAGEEERALLAVQIGKLAFEIDMVMGVAADVARAAGAGADIVQRLFHRRDHLGMLAHGEIIVRAPHGDRLGPVVACKAARVWKGTLVAQDVDKDPVAAFGMQTIDRLRKGARVINRSRGECVSGHGPVAYPCVSGNASGFGRLS